MVSDSRPETGWDWADPDDPLFAAVREEVLRYGVRRATLSSIAQRAGVSRMTVYRRVGGVRQLVLDALVAEFTAILGRAVADVTRTDGADSDGADSDGADTDGADSDGADTDGADSHGADSHGADTDGRSRLVATLRAGITALAEAPLTAALREHDPDLLLPYLVDRHGTNQRHILALLGAGIRAGQADGSVRDGDPELLALVLLHATQDFVISSRIIAGAADPAAVMDELGLLLDRYLRP